MQLGRRVKFHLNAISTTAASTQALKSREHRASNGFCADIITLSKDDGRLKEAMSVLHQDSTDLNPSILAWLLQACTRAESLAEGKHVHTHIIKTGFKPDTFLWNNVLNMYAKCRCLKDARQVFDKMSQRSVVSWTAMITAYSQHEQAEEALRLFEEMQIEGREPNHYTFSGVVKACSSLAALEFGRHVHDLVIRTGFQSDVVVMNALVDMYAKCGCVQSARQVFDKMPERNAVSWNTMIAGYCQRGDVGEALKLFWQIPQPDIISWNAMIAGFAQNELEDEALRLFYQMRELGMEPDKFTFASVLRACAGLAALEHGKQIHAHIIVTGFESNVSGITALVDMYAKCTGLDDASKLFNKVSKEALVSDSVMIGLCGQNGVDMYSKCGSIVDAHMVSDEMHSRNEVPQTAKVGGGAQHGRGDVAEGGAQYGRGDVVVRSALIDMYSKCGNIENAYKVFCKMHKRDVVSWTAMIAGLAQHGRGVEAIQLFQEMLSAGMKPNEITFVGVLSACSHGGLVDQGYYYFDTMRREYGIIPRAEHYSCMVDLLGRAGYLEEAENFIAKMPVEPDASVWGTLLGACMVHGNIVLGKHAAECLLELKQDASTFVILANIYATEGQWDDAAKVRNMMKDRGIKKQPGCSWIEIKNKIHLFVAGDMAHLQSDKICAMLDSIAGQIKQAGYRPNTEFLLHDLE